MLTIHSIKSDKDREPLYQIFDPQNSCWVVSDLQSKKGLRKHFLQSREAIVEEAVLRAGELWKLLLYRSLPGYDVISRKNFSSWLKATFRRLYENEKSIFFAEQFHDETLQLMMTFASVFYQENGVKGLLELAKEKNFFESRWFQQLFIAERLWEIAHAKKWVLPEWVVHLLASERSNLNLKHVNLKSLWFDLGADLRQAEADFILKLSQMGFHIHVIFPQFSQKRGESVVFQPYETFSIDVLNPSHDKMPDENPLAEVFSSVCDSHFHEVSTAVLKVRHLIASHPSIELEKIVIAAPLIEDYWPLLSKLLDAEGIPSDKPVIAKGIDFPWGVRLLSRAKIVFGQAKYIDQHVVERFQNPLNARLLNLRVINEDEDANGLHFKEFIERIFAGGAFYEMEWISFFSGLDVFPFLEEKMTGIEWIHWLEQNLLQHEVTLRSGDTGGIQIVNLSEMEHLNVSELIILGVSRDQLRPEQFERVPIDQMNAIHSHLGYFLRHLEQSRQVVNLRWILASKKTARIHLLYSETDFEGKKMSAHPLWFEHPQKEIEIQGSLLWNQQKSATISSTVQGTRWAFNEQRVEVSVSGIDDYQECSFRWAVNNRLRLRAPSDNEFEVTPMDSGTLMHDLLELSVREGWYLNAHELKMDDLRERVSRFFQEKDQQKISPHTLVRLIAENKLVEQLHRFLLLEQEFRNRFPQVETVAFEQEFNLDFHSSDTEFRLKGKIDRVDRINEDLHIIDYKSNLEAKHKYQNFSETFKYTQLLSYSMAAESTWLSKNPLKSATIISYRKPKRGGGFQILPEQLVNLNDCQLITDEDWAELKNKAKSLYLGIFEKIRLGKFQAVPEDEGVCKKCQWRRVCRAPHLFN